MRFSRKFVRMICRGIVVVGVEGRGSEVVGARWVVFGVSESSDGHWLGRRTPMSVSRDAGPEHPAPTTGHRFLPLSAGSRGGGEVAPVRLTSPSREPLAVQVTPAPRARDGPDRPDPVTRRTGH